MKMYAMIRDYVTGQEGFDRIRLHGETMDKTLADSTTHRSEIDTPNLDRAAVWYRRRNIAHTLASAGCFVAAAFAAPEMAGFIPVNEGARLYFNSRDVATARRHLLDAEDVSALEQGLTQASQLQARTENGIPTPQHD